MVVTRPLSAESKPNNISEAPRLHKNMNVVLVNCFFLVNPNTSMLFVTTTAEPNIIWIILVENPGLKESPNVVFVSEWLVFIMTIRLTGSKCIMKNSK